MKPVVLLAAKLFAGVVLLALASFAGLSAALLIAVGLLMLAAFLWLEGRVELREAVPFITTPNGAAGLALQWVSVLGIAGLLMVLLADGTTGLAVMFGLCGGLALASVALLPELARQMPGSVPDYLRARFPGAAGCFGAAVIGVLAFAAMVLLFAIAGDAVEQALGVPSLLSIAIMGGFVGFLLLPGGAAGLAKSGRILLGVMALLLIPAIWLSVPASGLVFPHVSWGLLVQEFRAVERVAMGASGYMVIDPGAFAIAGFVIAAGSAVMPQLLQGVCGGASGAAVERGSACAFGALLVLLTPLPLFAVALRIAGGAEAVPSLADAVSLLAPPAWLLAVLAVASLAACLAAISGAALSCLAAFGLHRRVETAGSALGSCRWMLSLLIFVSAVVAVLLPVNPATALLSLVAVCGACLFAPLMLSLHWHRMTGAGAVAGMIAGAAASAFVLLLPVGGGGLSGFVFALALSMVASVGGALCSKPPERGHALIRYPGFD